MEKNNSEATVKVANRYVNHERISSIKSVTMVFDRPQVRALLQLRDSMEKNFIKFNVRELDGDRLIIFSLLNTILMDIEDIDEVETKWAGDKIMDERLAKLRNEEYVRKEEERIAANKAGWSHFDLSVFEYRMKDPETGKLGKVVNVIELVLPVNNNLSEEYIHQEIDRQIQFLVDRGSITVVNSSKDERTVSPKKDEADYVREYGEIAIIQVE